MQRIWSNLQARWGFMANNACAGAQGQHSSPVDDDVASPAAATTKQSARTLAAPVARRTTSVRPALLVHVVDCCFTDVALAMQQWHVAPADVHVVARVGQVYSQRQVVAAANRLGIPIGQVSCVYAGKRSKSADVEADNGLVGLTLRMLTLQHAHIGLITVDQDLRHRPGEPPTVVAAVEKVLASGNCKLRVGHFTGFQRTWWMLRQRFADRLQLVDLRTGGLARAPLEVTVTATGRGSNPIQSEEAVLPPKGTAFAQSLRRAGDEALLPTPTGA